MNLNIAESRSSNTKVYDHNKMNDNTNQDKNSPLMNRINNNKLENDQIPVFFFINKKSGSKEGERILEKAPPEVNFLKNKNIIEKICFELFFSIHIRFNRGM